MWLHSISVYEWVFFYLSRHHEVICLTAGWANENQAGLILLPPHATDSLCLIQTPLYVHITNMRSAVGYELACGLSRNLRDIKEQFLLCAAELTPQNTRPHGTDAVQTRPPQWKVGPPLREKTSTFLLPRVPASAINYKTTVREAEELLHTDPLFMKSHVMKVKGLACYKTMLIICRVK